MLRAMRRFALTLSLLAACLPGCQEADSCTRGATFAELALVDGVERDAGGSLLRIGFAPGSPIAEMLPEGYFRAGRLPSAVETEAAGESALEVSPPVIAVSAPVLGELMVRLRDLDGWLSSGETTLTFSVAFPDRRHFTDCEHAGMDDVYYLNVVVRFASDGTVSETSFSEALLLGDE